MLTDTLNQLVLEVLANIKKIVLIFSAVIIASVPFLKHEVIYKFSLKTGLCVYELGCQELGFVYFEDILKSSIMDKDDLLFINWNTVSVSNRVFSNAQISLDVFELDAEVKNTLLENYAGLVQTLKLENIKDEWSIYHHEQRKTLMRRINFVVEADEILRLIERKHTSPFSFFLQRLFFMATFSISITLLWTRYMPLLARR